MFDPTLFTKIDPDVFKEFAFSSATENETLIIQFVVLDAENGSRHARQIRLSP